MSTKQSERNKRYRAAELSNDHVDEMKKQLGHAKRIYLVAAGWKETCRTPGSIWLWTKRIDVIRNERAPAYHKVNGMTLANPEAGRWTEVTESFDALMSLDLAYTIQINLDMGG